jgi:hypothetical protein
MKRFERYNGEDESSEGSSQTFFSHVFNFEGEGKADILNVLQYSSISLIPIMILNKIIQYIIPEASDEKGSFELSAEVLGQVLLMLLGLILIDRFVTYFKPYSGEDYPKHSVLFFSLGFLMIVLSIQSKLGEKVSILSERVMTFFNSGNNAPKKKNKPKYSSSDVQLLSTQNSISPMAMNNGTTSIDQLPVVNSALQGPTVNSTQTQMNYGGMMDEPVAANGLLGGSFGSAW